VRFGLPLTENNFFTAGLTADFTEVELSANSPVQYRDFCGNTTGCTSNSVQLSAGWTHDTRDNILFTNKGVLQRLTAEVTLPVLDLQYYRLDYRHAWYKDIAKNFTFMLNGELGYAKSYGDTKYPFFKNYFVGGVNSVRGFENGSLGPRQVDTTGQEFNIGGTTRIVGNAEIFAPVPLIKDSSQFRLSAFFDAGNVYADNQSISLGDLRYSTGVGVSWFSPFGPLKLVFAKALNEQQDDRTEVLQFQLGSQF
jgi:outer membrane protein insertion porin family